jgi:hypothetical protein
MNVLDLDFVKEYDSKDILKIEKAISDSAPAECSYIGISTNESSDSSNDPWWLAKYKFLSENSSDFNPDSFPGFKAPHNPAMYMLSNFKHTVNYVCSEFAQLRISDSDFYGLNLDDAPNDVVYVFWDGPSDADIELTWYTKSGEKCATTPMNLKSGLEGPAYSAPSETIDRARCPIPVLSKMVR